MSVADADRGRPRILAFDLIRAVAILLVLLDHLLPEYRSGQEPSNFELIGKYWFTGPDAVLFFLLSGALLLPVSGSWRGFYTKRIGRVAIPWVFWGLFYAFFICWIYHWPSSFSLFLARWFWVSPSFPPGWFLNAIIGIYIVMPVISPWLVKASRRQIELMLAFWLGAGLLPWLNYLMGATDFEKTLFGCFFNYLGYALAGYYLVRYPLTFKGKRSLITYALILLGAVIPWAAIFIPSNMPVVDFLYNNMTFNVMSLSILFFSLLLTVKSAPKPLAWLIRLISRNAFGIYLIHYALRLVLFKRIDPEICYTWWGFPIVTLASLLLSETLRRIPYLRRLVI